MRSNVSKNLRIFSAVLIIASLPYGQNSAQEIESSFKSEFEKEMLRQNNANAPLTLEESIAIGVYNQMSPSLTTLGINPNTAKLGLRLNSANDNDYGISSQCNSDLVLSLNYDRKILNNLFSNISDIQCVGVTPETKDCSRLDSCVIAQQTSNDIMGSIFLDSHLSSKISESFTKVKLEKMYTEMIAFDAMAAYAKEKYGLAYPTDLSRDKRKGCYYGLDLSPAGGRCEPEVFIKQLDTFIDDCAKSSSCGNQLAKTEKPSLDSFSKERNNIKTHSFSMDYLMDQRDQLAEHFIEKENKIADDIYDLLKNKDFQNKKVEDKIKMLEGTFKHDALLSFLQIEAKNKNESLSKNKAFADFLKFKPTSREQFLTTFEQFKKSEITKVMQLDKLRDGKACEPRENVTVICAKAKAVSKGEAVVDKHFRQGGFSLSPEEKRQVLRDSAHLISAKVAKSEQEKSLLNRYLELFMAAKFCKINDPTLANRSSGNDDRSGLSSSLVNTQNILDDFDVGIDSYYSGMSSTGADLLGIDMKDYDSDLGVSMSNGQIGDAGIEDYAKSYANPVSTPVDTQYPDTTNSFQSSSTYPSYIPNVSANSAAKQVENTAVAANSVAQESQAGWVKNQQAGSVGISDELKIAKEELAKSQAEMKKFKEKAEKDKLDGLEAELAKKQRELDKLAMKVTDLEKDREKEKNKETSDSKDKKSLSMGIKPSSQSSMASLGGGNSSAKVDNSPGKYENKVTAPSAASSSSSSATRAPASDSTSRSPSAILSTSGGGEARAAISSNAQVVKVDGLSNKDMRETIKKKINELSGASFYIEENGVIKEIIVETKDGKLVLDENGNPVYKEVEIGKANDKLFAKPKDTTTAPKVRTAADLKKLDEKAVKSNNDRGAFYQNLIKETKKVIKAEEKK